MPKTDGYKSACRVAALAIVFCTATVFMYRFLSKCSANQRIWAAVQASNLSQVERAIAEGADTNCVKPSGVISGFQQIVSTIRRGQKASSYRVTLLPTAVDRCIYTHSKASYDILRLLVQKGGRDGTDSGAMPAIDWATMCGDVRSVQILASAGAVPGKRSSDVDSVETIDLALYSSLMDAPTRRQVVSILLGSGICSRAYYTTALHKLRSNKRHPVDIDSAYYTRLAQPEVTRR